MKPLPSRVWSRCRGGGGEAQGAGGEREVTADASRVLARCWAHFAHFNSSNPYNPGVRYYPHFIDGEAEVK